MAYVFKTVQVLVALVTIFALVWLLLLHTRLARIRRRCLRIYDGERTVSVLMELLILMTMLFVVPA